MVTCHTSRTLCLCACECIFRANILWQIVFGTLGELLDVDFGAPLHCLVIVGETHPVEKEVRTQAPSHLLCGLRFQ